jgi:hypothetical protein
MGEHAAAKVVQQREVKAWIGSLQAESIRPIHAAADRIGRLAVGQPSIDCITMTKAKRQGAISAGRPWGG